MVTGRSLFGVRAVRRARALAGTAPGTGVRRWWPLLILLLAVAWSHGLGVENGTAHVEPGTATPGVVAAAHHEDPGGEGAGHGHPHQESAHTGGTCLSGKPETRPAVDAPCPDGQAPATAAGGAR
ncbi:hypothetical protein I3F58_16980, partial [Streptomyces sp. MUM 203J]|nr:hypothetical protein [Streptomyces sp. MUM 203J]